MPEPTLSEILNNADPERGTGQPAVVYEHKNLVDNLNQAAQIKAQNDWNKYNLYLKTVNDQYKDVNEIAKMPIMTKDLPLIKQQMADIVQGIAKDPHSFFSGGDKYGEVQGKIAKLTSDATESKQNGIFDFAHRQYLYAHPELNNEDNKGKIDQFVAQPLGARQPYLFDIGGVYDPEAMAKKLSENVKTVDQVQYISPDGQFYGNNTMTKYDPDKYGKLAELAYNQVDANGVPLRKTWSKLFNGSPDLKKKYEGVENPERQAFIDDLKARMLADSETKGELKSVPGWKSKGDIALDWFKAQTQRIGAGANATRARAYADLAHAKLSGMNNDEKVAVGYWNDVVKNIKEYSVRHDDKSGTVHGMYVFAGDLPKGHRFMSGVGADGKPIELQPFKSPAGVEYYKTRYTDKNGEEYTEDKLKQMFFDNRKRGYTGSYGDAVRDWVKNGALDLYVVGESETDDYERNSDGSLKMNSGKNPIKIKKKTPAVANFNSMMESTRALSNKINSNGEEPIFNSDESYQNE